MMAARAPMRIGLVGCGNISDIYLQNGPRFRDIVFTACADLNAEAANRQAERYAIQARSVKDLLKSDDVDIVLNLTIPGGPRWGVAPGDRSGQARLFRETAGDRGR